MIALADAKAHPNITFPDDDALIQAKLDAATAWVAAYTGSAAEPAPAPVTEAILQLLGHLYANREASLVGVTAQALPFGFLDLLQPYRAWAF